MGFCGTVDLLMIGDDVVVFSTYFEGTGPWCGVPVVACGCPCYVPGVIAGGFI